MQARSRVLCHLRVASRCSRATGYCGELFYGDIVARHEAWDVANLRDLAVHRLTNNARPTSINKLKRSLSISLDRTEHNASAILESM